TTLFRSIQSQLVAVVNVVVDQSRQQVVGGADGVDVAGEVQVDLVGGDDAGAPAAGGAALDAKHRPHGGLPQRSGGFFPKSAEGMHEADGHGRIALACRRSRGVRRVDELPVWRWRLSW